MKVLVACEYSGRVRDAFIAQGHNAMSCDMLPSETEGPHYQGDVRDVLGDGWDLMIAHPPCTRLTNSGVRWLHVPPPGKTKQEMLADLDAAADFYMLLRNAPIMRKVNPDFPGDGKPRLAFYGIVETDEEFAERAGTEVED